MLINADAAKPLTRGALYWRKNKEKLKIQNRKWYLENQDKVRESNNKYQRAHPEKRKEWSSRSYRKKKETKPEYYLHRQSKRRAKEGNLDFNIGIEDIVIPQNCPYFNRPLLPLDKEWAPSLDRIDNSKGYIKGNIRVISYKANRVKNNLTIDELLQFAKGVMVVHSQEVIDCAH